MLSIDKANIIIYKLATIMETSEYFFIEESRLGCSRAEAKEAIKHIIYRELLNEEINWETLSALQNAYAYLSQIIDDSVAETLQGAEQAIRNHNITNNDLMELNTENIKRARDKGNVLLLEIIEYIGTFENGKDYANEMKDLLTTK